MTTPTDSLARPEARKIESAQAVYHGPVLWSYDLIVHGLSNPFVWRCPTGRLLAHYQSHVSANHLEAGVGTGYFPEHAHFPSRSPHLALLDLNADCLRHAARRLSRYSPEVYQANLLQPLALRGPGFDSVSLMYVMHCLPGNRGFKSQVFHHLKSVLNRGGVLFGATILADGVPMNALAKRLMATYNRRGIFNNEADSLEWLRNSLHEHFNHVQVEQQGCVALFSAYD